MTGSINIPRPFSDLLQGSDLAGPVYDFVTRTSTILSDNKLPFFPHYTDHGVHHVERVLATISQHLIPNDVVDLLNERDSSVIITAALLHDIAMHLQPKGFLDLIHGRTKLKPIAWFETPGNTLSADSQWGDEWASYVSEVQRFNDRRFTDILGRVPSADSMRHWGLEGLPEDPMSWSEFDRLLIGEFLRRHHGRIAHEIALYGFPGLSNEEFPPLRKTLPELANLSGVVARSHAISLREAAEYLKHQHRGDLRPRGVLVVYHMALLRVSDYLQIDSSRAPRLLFKLRSPQICKTIDEWNKHGAVVHISFVHEDPAAIKIELDQRHSLRTHILLSDLVSDLQLELDTSSAVLSEVYGPRTEDGLNVVRLKKSRLDSNHSDAALLEGLPYLPVEARLDADPRLLSLMIEPLYGFFPEIAVRELIQNAIDAVLECRHHCQRRGLRPEDLSFHDQDCDVLVDIERQEDGSWVLSVIDKGIGMKTNTISSYFLRAGASLRESQAWRDLFVNQQGCAVVSRSGRFGVGVFAAFLLGNSLEVTTRHVDEAQGVRFTTTRDNETIELLKADTPAGTSITIRLSNAAAEWIEKHRTGESWDWFALKDPRVKRKITVGGQRTTLKQSVVLDLERISGELAGWGLIRPDGFGPVVWGSEKGGSLFLNGLAISRVEKSSHSESNTLSRWRYSWDDNFPFSKPLLAVSDPEAALPLTLLRDRLTGPFPFEHELKEDILLDFIAFTLASAPREPIFSGKSGRAYAFCYPLLESHSLRLPWFCSKHGVGPFDRSLIRACNATRILLSGELIEPQINAFSWPSITSDLPDSCFCMAISAGAFPSHDERLRHLYGETKKIGQDESVRMRLIDVVSSLRNAGKGEFLVHAARICARSAETNRSMSFGAGDSFQPAADLNAILDAWQETSIAVSYDWSSERRNFEDKQRRQQRIPFAAELLVSPRDGDSVLGSRWLDIIGPTLVPFEESERNALLEKVRGTADMARRIEKWERKLDN